MISADVLTALGLLNGHARVARSSGLRETIYGYKQLATLLLAQAGQVSLRFIRLTTTCNRCTGGRFRHWDWEDGQTVACRHCGGSGRKVLRFTETTLPDGQVWHHPWEGAVQSGLPVAQMIGAIEMRDVAVWYFNDAPIGWQEPGAWSPNLPGLDLDLAQLVPLLNTVEDWVEGLSSIQPRGLGWPLVHARRCLSQLKHPHVHGAPSHSYQLDLGRAPGGCFVCGDVSDLAGFTYGRMTPLFHWSLPVCQRHGTGPEKADHPNDPPPAALLSPDLARWLARHERVEESER